MSKNHTNASNEAALTFTMVLVVAVTIITLATSTTALVFALVTAHREANQAAADVRYEISEQCSLYALVGELPPSLDPPTSKFAMGLVTDLRNKYTSLGCPGKLPVSAALTELDNRYHLHLDKP